MQRYLHGRNSCLRSNVSNQMAIIIIIIIIIIITV